MFLAAALSIAPGCSKDSSLPIGPGSPPDPSATLTRVQREIFTPSCALPACHTGDAPVVGLNLEAGRSRASLAGVESVETRLLRVAPFLPEDSYLVIKVRGDAAILGGRMPRGAPPLQEDRIRLVVDWVRRGAPDD